jgi:HEAT repeat protein
VESDDATLVEPLENELLRASYDLGENGEALLVAHFDSSNVRHRVLALRGLVRQSLVNADLWHRALRDENVEIRREALQQLAHAPLEDTTVLDDAVRMLSDDDALVVEGAAFALGEHLCVGAVVELCDVATNHEDARCRESAVAALGAIGDDRARMTIISALKDKPTVRRRAIVALSNYDGPDVETALDQASDDRDWQVRSAVTQLRNTER